MFSPSCSGWAPPSEPSGRIKINRPRGMATGAALVAPAMNMVRGPVAARGPDACFAMRVPQAPQKANPACTPLPQVGQGTSPPPTAGEGVSPAAPVTRTGAGVAPAGTPTAPPLLVPTPAVTRGAGVPASGFGGSWNGIGAGILGESPQGMPLRALGAAGEEVRSSPATAAPIEAGGSTVRSRAGSRPSICDG